MGSKYFWVIFVAVVVYWGVDYAQQMTIEDEQEVAPLRPAPRIEKEVITEDEVTLLIDDEDILRGERIYRGNCSPCHGLHGEGNMIGSNLTDKYWIHGGSFEDIFKQIKEGTPSKGMVAWKRILSTGEIRKVTSYIISLQGTTSPNAREQEGELYEGGY